jgi:phage replication-related protein YjqB (UPF0714/DUF867 family)
MMSKIRGIQVPHPTFTDEEAEANSEFVERISDEAVQKKLIVIAPHGGMIEPFTDRQAEHMSSRLSPHSVSLWMCKGWNEGGGAYDRWHITSTDISEASFPKLQRVIDRRFRYAVAFHGWREDFILIGGTAPFRLKKSIQASILNAVSDSGIDVVADEEGCSPPRCGGNHPANLVNRLGRYGIQIEQCLSARKNYWIQIANAVAKALNPKIEAKVDSFGVQGSGFKG